VNIGAYRTGSNPRIDKALELIAPIRTFLKQGTHEEIGVEETLMALAELALAGREETSSVDEPGPVAAEAE